MSDHRFKERTVKQSMHCFHLYAVASRVDMSPFIDELPTAVVSPESVLPSISDVLELHSEFEILVSRYSIYHNSAYTDIYVIIVESLFSTWTSLKTRSLMSLGILIQNTQQRWQTSPKWYVI